jgi:hypothetical protein
VRQILTINGMNIDLEWKGNLEISKSAHDSIIIKCDTSFIYHSLAPDSATLETAYDN